MGITLQDFIDMAIDNYYDCYSWDNEDEESVFSGEIAGNWQRLVKHCLIRLIGQKLRE